MLRWPPAKALVLALFGAVGVAQALEVNQASQAELESLPGIGPALSEHIMQARGDALFRDWNDLRTRVRGLGAAQAARLSKLGLTVAGASFDPDAATPGPRKKHPAGPAAGASGATTAVPPAGGSSAARPRD